MKNEPIICHLHFNLFFISLYYYSVYVYTEMALLLCMKTFSYSTFHFLENRYIVCIPRIALISSIEIFISGEFGLNEAAKYCPSELISTGRLKKGGYFIGTSYDGKKILNIVIFNN